MTTITIKSQLDFVSYRNAMFHLFYRKPIMLIISILGVVMLVLSLAYAITVFNKIGHFPYIPLMLGLIFVFLMPYSVYSQAKKNYAAKPRIKEYLVYTFDDDKISVTGETFSGKIPWSKIVSVQELKNCILLYQSSNTADIISRRAFSHEQLSAFRELINKKTTIKKR